MPDRDDLILRWDMGQTDASDEAVLAELLRDPAARRTFVRNARVAAALGTPVAKGAARTSTPTTPSRKKTLRFRRSRPTLAARWAIAAGLVLTTGLAALLMMMPRRGAIDQPGHIVQQAAVPVVAPFAHLETAGVAQIRSADGRQRAGRDGDALIHGDTVDAGAGAAVITLRNRAARLELIAGSALSLPADHIDPTTSTVQLNLASGRVRAEVAPRPAGAPFIITSSLASAKVVGTRFTFGLDRDGARLAVDSGAVRLFTPTDAGVLVTAGRSGIVSDDLVSTAPAAADADQPLPAGAYVLWRYDPTGASGWRGVSEDAANGGPAWRSVVVRQGDQWCSAELRSPQARNGWVVATGTWLRFRYHVERLMPGTALEVHLKPEDETNYAQRLIVDTTDGWHQALLRVDGEFRHLERNRQPLAVGERLHGAVWCAMRDEGTQWAPARFWIRDAVVFTAP